jgi:nucleotide-binding universal stress UspA family protein
MIRDVKRIIIPVDNTENSKKAVKEGVFLANLLGAKAKIITVNDTHQFISSVVLEEKLKREASAFLNGFKKIAEDSGVKTETQLLVGKPAEEIVKFANGDDLIIISPHNKTKGIDKVMEESVSRDVVRYSPCPVLVLKSKK